MDTREAIRHNDDAPSFNTERSINIITHLAPHPPYNGKGGGNFSDSLNYKGGRGLAPYPPNNGLLLGTLDAFVHLPAAANSIVDFAQLNNKKRNLSWM